MGIDAMNEPKFTLFISKLLCYGMALTVAIMFLRNFFPFAVPYAPFVIGSAFMLIIVLRILAGERIEIPRPTKSDIMPFLPCLIIALILLPYFIKNPIFPDLPSTDLRGHAVIARGIAQGESNPISSQVLYFGIHYLLAIAITLFPDNLLVTIRLTMALIVIIISPYIVYYASLRLFDNHRAAWMTSLFYSLTGFVWFVQIFNVGIFANFFAGLASLMLIAVSIDFIKQKGVSSLILLCLALLTAYLSHFTALFLMIPLAIGLVFYSWKEKAKMRGVVAAALILTPILFGLFFATSITQTLFSLLQEGTGSPLQQTWLSSFLPLPVLKHMVSQVNNDYLMMLLLAALLIFSVKMIRGFKSHPLHLIPLGLFLLIVSTAPLNDAAWRFSFVTHLPLTMMAGYVLSLPIQKLKLRAPRRMSDTVPKWQVGITLLLIFPIFIPSWGSISLAVSSVNPEQANQQVADYQAMQWIAQNIPQDYYVWNGKEGWFESANLHFTNRFLSITDSRFDYATLFGTPLVLYAPNFHIITTDPFSVANLAINQSANYVIITREMTLPKFPCNKPFDLTLSANATQIFPNDVVRFNLVSTARVNASASLILDRDSADTQLINGKSYLEVIFKEAGNYTVYALVGTMSTYPLTISVGNERGGSASVGVPERFCDPWHIFSPYSLKGSEIVYENEMVKILKL